VVARGGGVLVSNNCFLQQNTTAALLELYFNDPMQTVYACGGGGGGSQQREVADGADVVFTDAGLPGVLEGGRVPQLTSHIKINRDGEWRSGSG